MQFSLSEEQLMISDTVERLLDRKWDASSAAELTSSDVVESEVWQELKTLGILGVALPESAGGGGMGARELSVLFRLFGRHQFKSPFTGSVVLAGTALSLAPASALRDGLLEKLAAGETNLAMAVLEGGARYDHSNVAMRAEPKGDGFSLTGCKRVVMDAGVADYILVSCLMPDKSSGGEGLALLALSRDTPGIRVEGYAAFDGSALTTILFEGVELSRDAVLIDANNGAEILDKVMSYGAFAAASETLGACEAAFEKTLDYMRVREQFDTPIAKFQALQHRASDLHADIEMLRSLVLGASENLALGDASGYRDASAAMAMAVKVGDRVCCEAIQMHGGIGMTQELGIGRYLLRVNALSRIFGDAGYHGDRYLRSLED